MIKSIISFSKRDLFHYSVQEYKANVKKCLTSNQRKIKTLKLKKGEDQKEVIVNLYGYPVCPMPHLYENDDKPTDFIENMGANNPDIVMVQIDPMQYLTKCRQFALSNLPLIKE